ncbi:MAG: isoprenyl transferase [Planctomycetes bacterium]|nr:isoprenyl transferase [Planctomycetota bacterium]
MVIRTTPKNEVPKELQGAHIPRHIAIIMDGNGRWARQQGFRRVFGHQSGAESVREITRECARLGVGRLTLYAFSADNWKRPQREIDFLMGLLKKYLVQERGEIMDNHIRFTAVGRLDALPANVMEELRRTKEISAANSGMTLCLALNYGARQELVDALRRIGRDIKSGQVDPERVDETLIGRYLYDPEAPDPDLLIRTGGDVRVSNFLLWQISYTELFVTPVMWPEFKKQHLHEAILDFSRRERRFGAIAESE